MNEIKRIFADTYILNSIQKGKIFPYITDKHSIPMDSINWDNIFTFDIVICTNEINTENHKFSIPALFQIKDLICGRIGDIDISSDKNKITARIYDSSVEYCKDKLTQDGEPLLYVKSSAFIKKGYPGDENYNCPFVKNIQDGYYNNVDFSCSIYKTHEIPFVNQNVTIIDSITDIYDWRIIPKSDVLKCPLRTKNGKCGILGWDCFNVDKRDCKNLKSAYYKGKEDNKNNENQNNN